MPRIIRNSISPSCLLIVLNLFYVSSAAGQLTWDLENDTEINWMFELQSKDELTTQYRLPRGGQAKLVLGEEPHYLETWYDSGDPDKRNELQRLGPIYVRQLINSEVKNVSQVRGPLTVWQDQVFTTRNGAKIYNAMTGFPTDEKAYGKFLKELQDSSWIGPRGEVLDLSRKRARRPTDANETILKNVQYVPGEKFYVVAEWHHDGASGEMFLVIDPKNKSQLTGNYKYRGVWQRESTTAKRVGANPVPEP